MKIAYKVISKTTRHSAIVSINNPFCLKYEKGAVVEAPKGTMGIFCFKTKEDAENFISMLLCRGLMIVRVSILDKIKVVSPTFISRYVDKIFLMRFYKFILPNSLIIVPPQGTVCYPKVKVLD